MLDVTTLHLDCAFSQFWAKDTHSRAGHSCSPSLVRACVFGQFFLRNSRLRAVYVSLLKLCVLIETARYIRLTKTLTDQVEHFLKKSCALY